MAHMALYRQWRPLAFEDVVEQSHIVTALRNSIKNHTINHAYLFCGTRGTGKTTLAKIFARAINCPDSVHGSPCNKCDICRGILDGSIIDIVEIDAASNNGVDDVREIKEAVMYVPAVTKYKVYIIDEVHMLSTGAFNALLKTLEEPPENVVFILATTEPHKLPATILSRCQRFDFKRITLEGLASRLKTIADHAEIPIENSALQLIARLSEGGMRDAISLLDQCISLGKEKILREDVVEISGLTASQTVDSFSEAIIQKETQRALIAIKTALDEGRDLQPLCTQVVDWFRNLMLFKTGGVATDLIDLDDEGLKPIRIAAENISLERTVTVIKELSKVENQLKWSENQRVIFEVAAIKLCSEDIQEDGSGLTESLKNLENRILALEKRLSQNRDNRDDVREDNTEKQIKNVELKKPRQKPLPINQKSETPTNMAGNNGQESLLEQWSDVIEYVCSSGQMKTYAYLQDTKCKISGSTANVVVSGDGGIKKSFLSRDENLVVLKDALKNTTGLNLTVKIVDDKELKSVQSKKEDDPDLERIKKFADDNNIPLNIQD